MHTHVCENCHQRYEHHEITYTKYGTPCTEIRNGFCSPECETNYPKRVLVGLPRATKCGVKAE